jgi:hypothetical protein
MDTEDLVSVYTVNSPTEAEIIRGVLESAGIACQIGGETQAGLAGVLSIDILTHASDAEAARKHLRQLKHITREERKKAHEEREHRREELNNAIREGKPQDEMP